MIIRYNALSLVLRTRYEVKAPKLYFADVEIKSGATLPRAGEAQSTDPRGTTHSHLRPVTVAMWSKSES